MQQLFIIQRKGFTAAQPDVYVLKGIFKDNYCGDHYFRAFYGMEELEVKLLVNEGAQVYRKYQSLDNGSTYVDREYVVCMKLPRRRNHTNRLRIFECQGRERVLLCQPDEYLLKKESETLNGHIDSVRYLTEEECKAQNLTGIPADKRPVEIRGWALAARPFSIEARDENGTVLEGVTETFFRWDIEKAFPEFFCLRADGEKNPACGFRTVFKAPTGNITVAVTDGYRIFETEMEQRDGVFMAKIMETAPEDWRRELYDEQGMGALVRHYLHMEKPQLQIPEFHEIEPPAYDEWQKQKDRKEETSFFLPDAGPLFSIVVPLFLTKQEHLEALVASIKNQTYEKWELCLSDGGGEESKLCSYLQKLCESDTRIRAVKSSRKLGISENTNAALATAAGDYIVFVDHDDLLHPQALAECAVRIQTQPDIDLIYTDEDKISIDGKEHFQPHFKPDYNRELLHSMNYFCHLVVVKRSLQQQAGLLDDVYNGAQDYDFVLRCAERAKQICHIPRVLYHWRAHRDSTAENPESKRYAFEAGVRALNAHYERCGISAKAELEEVLGMYRKVWHRSEKLPMISVIVHGKGCKEFVLSYPETEVIRAVGTDSFALNAAAKTAKGELLLFWNTDLKLLTSEGLREMAELCLQDGAAAVGPKVLYENGRIRQCGVIFEKDGGLYRAFEGFTKEDIGYFARINTVMEVSVLLKECMMVRRSLFESLGGFDTALQKEYADADFCLRAKQKGLRSIYCPWCVCSLPMVLAEEVPFKVRTVFAERWKEILSKGDPNYNPNLSARCADYSLRLQ